MLDDRDDAPAPVPSRLARAGSRIRGLALDLTPLRESRQFRLLWLGEVVSHTGRHITVVALPYQVYLETRSALAVGMIGLAQVAPLIAGSIVGGVIADTVDRRKLLMLAQIGLAGSSGLLVAGAMADDPPLWLLYSAAALIAGLTGLDAPARIAAIPNLVPADRVSSAIVLNQVVFQVGDVVGPALGGLILARFGLTWAYGVDAITFGAAVATLAAMRPMPPSRAEEEPRGLAAVREGFAYLKGRRVIQATFWADINAMVFGMPRALFPVLAAETFRVGPAGLGLLYSAPAAGALAGAVSTGWVRNVRRQGQAVLWAVAVWGLAIVAFGLSTGAFWLALVFLAVAGAADVISAVFRGTMLQAAVPDRLRGRLSSIHFAVVVGGPRLGDVEAGVVAQLTSPVFSVISGGVACVIGIGILAALIPEFARYRSG
jgi:predicted MFS family arabinose efflux permease